MLKNAYLLAKIGADTAENEGNLAEILPKFGNYPTGPQVNTTVREQMKPKKQRTGAAVAIAVSRSATAAGAVSRSATKTGAAVAKRGRTAEVG